MSSRKVRLYISLAILIVAAGSTFFQPFREQTPTPETGAELSATSTPTSNPDFHPVIRSVDGDTLIVDVNGAKETIRLIGIDTPETVDPRKPVQCFGKEASETTKRLVEGHSVKLVADTTQGDTDKYGRLLRYVFTDNDIFLNDYLVREGYAHEYTYRLPYLYQSQFEAAETEARTLQRGLWNPKICATP